MREGDLNNLFSLSSNSKGFPLTSLVSHNLLRVDFETMTIYSTLCDHPIVQLIVQKHQQNRRQNCFSATQTSMARL